jgi:hypothetical protein
MREVEWKETSRAGPVAPTYAKEKAISGSGTGAMYNTRRSGRGRRIRDGSGVSGYYAVRQCFRNQGAT